MWPTKHVELQRIEELLKCGICYELMRTSVMTLCSHNYCSICIRRYLTYKTQCPTCFVETFDKDLRTNKVLDEIIVQYQNIKEKFEKDLYNEETESVKHDDVEDACSSNNFECKKETYVPNVNGILHKVTDSPVSAAIISTPRTQKTYNHDISSPSTSMSSKIPSIFTPKSKNSFRNEQNYKIVNCPVCKVNVPENNINKHLDDCLKREDMKNQPKKVEQKRKPLAKLVLSLMKDSAVRKKLKEFGLSSQGDRRVLENRLQRYIILYNAECDEMHPRPVSVLIKQCQEEENLERNIQKPSNRLNVNRNTEQNVIEQQRKIYLIENKDSFDQLIKKIKTAGNSRKSSVKRDILSKGNFDSVHKDSTKDNVTVKDNERSESLIPMNSYIDDSDSNASCPLQMYSSENPMDFLAVELSMSPKDNGDHHASLSKQDTSNVPYNINSALVDSIVKRENVVRTEISSPFKSMKHKEMDSNLSNNETNISHGGKCDILRNIIDIDVEKSCSELVKTGSRSRKRISELFAKENSNSKRCDEKKYDTRFGTMDKWEERELCDQFFDPKEDIECIDLNDSDNQLSEKSKQQLHNIKEHVSDCIKFEKENMESVDENIISSVPNRSHDNINIVRKRECDITLSDDERIGDKTTNVKKSARFGLSETIGFNNEKFCQSTLQIEEKLKEDNVQLRAACEKTVNRFVKRSMRLRSKINNNGKK